MQVLNSDDPDWFWVSRFDGSEGFVPAGFIYPLDALQRQREYKQFSFLTFVDVETNVSPCHHPLSENLANSKPVPNTKPMVSQQQFQQQQHLSNNSMQQQPQPRPQFQQHHPNNLNRNSTGPMQQHQV